MNVSKKREELALRAMDGAHFRLDGEPVLVTMSHYPKRRFWIQTCSAPDGHRHGKRIELTKEQRKNLMPCIRLDDDDKKQVAQNFEYTFGEKP